jgi:mannitol-1-/sugar-/sorbitol-6-phosphatase
MLTLNCQAILFDLDGTLVDSAIRVQRLWIEWSQRRGIDTGSLLEVMHGRRADETIRMVAPHLSVQDEFLALEAEEIADMEGVRPYPSAGELLGTLSSRQWAIVTSGTRRVAEARMRHVGLPTPKVFITADDVNVGKPAPDGYLLAASRLNLKPTDCIVVEDAPAGIQAGKSAGMRVIAVASTLTREVLRQADVAIHHLSEIKLRSTSQGIQIRVEQ